MVMLPIIHTPSPYPMVEPTKKRRPKLNLIDDHAVHCNAVFKNLLKEKKLSLVLDLDQTLLHSARFKDLTLEEQALILKQTDDPKVVLFRTEVSGVSFVTKLRTGLAHFLEEVSKLFSLHVFTKGGFGYTSKMLELIDPGRVNFECPSRIFTRESCSYTSDRKKTLDLVVGERRGIWIMDDLERVWKEKDRENLIVISRYKFFCNSGRAGEGGKSKLVMGTDESETDGNLNSILDILMWIHEKFFDTKTEDGSLILGTRYVRKLIMDFYGSVGE